jgi:hypothetical protein
LSTERRAHTGTESRGSLLNTSEALDEAHESVDREI